MTLTIYDSLEQGTPEWLEARRGIVTASTIGQLITAKTVKPASNDTARGLYATLIAERITGHVDPVQQNRAMLRGSLLEDEARREYEKLHGAVEQIGFARLDGAGIIIGASPDGRVGTVGGIEIKSPSQKTHVQTALSGRIPAYNRAQVQACMYVLDADWWDFISYLPGEPLYIIRDYPDPRWQTAIADAARAFETIARAQVDQYQRNTRGLPKTEYWDPFDTGEEIY